MQVEVGRLMTWKPDFNSVSRLCRNMESVGEVVIASMMI